MKINRNKDIFFSNCSGVFQGGGCKAIAYIGAYEEAYKHGVLFSELAGTSAGSIIAAAIALGATPSQIKDFVMDLDFRTLIRKPKATYTNSSLNDSLGIQPKNWKEKLAWKYWIPCLQKHILWLLKQSKYKIFEELDIGLLINEYGLFDSGALTEKLRDWFSTLHGQSDPKFKDLSVNLHILAGDVPNHTMKIYNKQECPEESIAEAVAASCSIPFFFTPPQKKFIDGGILSNRPDVLLENKTEYFRTLSFSLKTEGHPIANIKDFTAGVIDTIIQGADDIQHKGLKVDMIEINCGKCGATDFDKMTSERILDLIEKGRNAMHTFFNKMEEDDKDLSTPHIHLYSMEQVYSQVAHWGLGKFDEIVVCSESLDWVWKLFPTIVGWSTNNVKLKVYYKNFETEKSKRQLLNDWSKKGKSISESEELYQRTITKQESIIRFLEAIGSRCVPINNKSKLPEGFYFKTGKLARAIVYSSENDDFRSKIYADTLDSFALSTLIPKSSKHGLASIKYCEAKPDEIINRLKGISHYANSEFAWEDVKPSDLRFLNKFIRGDKYKQILHMFELYPNNVEVFSPAKVGLKNGKTSLVGPIVVEEHDGLLYIIEGNTRVLFSHKHNIQQLKVLVVRNVSSDLPIDMSITRNGYGIEEVLISEMGREGKKRYNGFNYNLFRPIEQALRPDAEYLL